ncbi:MAG: small basic family protein [Clostridia bacterium]|nr:small basic family protein [Clostridia bacterium]
MIPFFGLIIGIVIGVFIPYNISYQYSNYVAVAILAALDSVFGGIAATLQGKFDMKVFLSGFFGNALLAAGLAYIGDQLGIQIYLAAIFAFGNRLFLNFAIIRRFVLNKYTKKDNILEK